MREVCLVGLHSPLNDRAKDVKRNSADTEVTLTRSRSLAILLIVGQKMQKSRPPKVARSPRIRVPNQERALFTVDSQNFVGVIKRLSLTGGSVIPAKGALPQGTLAEMGLNTVFGKARAHIEFLHTGADGIPSAQAFRFLAMDDLSRERFSAAVEQMQRAGFSDAEEKQESFDLLHQRLDHLRQGIRRFSETITHRRDPAAKK